MGKLRYLFRNINLLNIALITAIIILANYAVLPMFNMSIKYTLPAGKKIIGDNEEKPTDSHIPSPSDYMMIAEENLFNPERKIPVEKKGEQSLPKPEFVLYGTLISDVIKLAYIEDRKSPRSTPGRGKRQTALKIGDTMSDFILKEIYHDKVVMVKGEDRIELKVTDPSKIRDIGVVAAKEPPKTVERPVSTPAKQPAAIISPEDRRTEKELRKQERELKRQKGGK